LQIRPSQKRLLQIRSLQIRIAQINQQKPQWAVPIQQIVKFFLTKGAHFVLSFSLQQFVGKDCKLARVVSLRGEIQSHCAVRRKACRDH
jgi:hypothetical protein